MQLLRIIVVLNNNLDKILVCHITNHINTMTENLFHESNEKLKEDFYYIGMMIDICYLINGCKSKRYILTHIHVIIFNIHTYTNVSVLQIFAKISQNRDYIQTFCIDKEIHFILHVVSALHIIIIPIHIIVCIL